MMDYVYDVKLNIKAMNKVIYLCRLLVLLSDLCTTAQTRIPEINFINLSFVL